MDQRYHCRDGRINMWATDSTAVGEGRFTGFGICELAMIDPGRNRRRYYCIAVQPGLFAVSVVRQWGRLGCRLRQKVLFFGAVEEAFDCANRLYRVKTGKGYRELTEPGCGHNISVSRDYKEKQDP
jgi:predicted DNA-binding WGR domain protein